ncbi:MAG: SH3 domain-containing protein [Pyrinomonadaceae bacterium]
MKNAKYEMKNVLAVVLIICGFVSAQDRFVKPVDEASQDPSFLAFRTKLISAAERKDANYIFSIVDPKIELSFGGDAGIPAFKRIWKINSKNSEFWTAFLSVIRNGGGFMGEGSNKLKLFAAPYTHSSWPEDLDGFEHHVIFGNNVNLRKSPDTNSEIVAKLSYNVVKIDPETLPKSGKSEYPDWWQITTLGGLKGYVKREFVRSPIDYRAGFEKKRGFWKMTFFIAGD